jgi:hypothetical protein
MRLAFQPVVYAADPTMIGFFEGFIRLLNLRDQVIPARDFMGRSNSGTGREIDCAALQMGLMAMQRNPQIGFRSTCRRGRSAIGPGRHPAQGAAERRGWGKA